MQRRSLLRAAGGTLAAGALPLASARQDPPGTDPFTPLTRLPLPGAKEAVVGADGETAYVATTDGFATVDVSDPAAPELLARRTDLLAEHEDGPLQRVQDVKVDGDRLAVAAPSNGSGLSGVLLYDVADPAAPVQLAFHETDFAIHNCDLADGLLALTANNGRDNPTVLVDVAGDDPVEVGRWSLYDVDGRWVDVHLGARSIHDITLVDDVAYLAHWDAGTWLLDVSDPGDPAVLGRAGGFTVDELLSMSDVDKGFQTMEPPGNAHYADVSDDGTVLAVGGESWDGHQGDGHGGPSGIDLYDVSDPATPEPLATIVPVVPRDARREGTWTTAHNFELTGDRLYSSWYQDGVRIHDVTDPANPDLLAHWRAPDEARFWTARLGRSDEFFVASDMGVRGRPDDAGLYLFPDRAGSQPDQPTIETATPTPPSTTPPKGSDTRTPTTPPSTPTLSPTPDPTPTETPTSTVTPGFGSLAALVGLGAAGWRLLRDGD